MFVCACVCVCFNRPYRAYRQGTRPCRAQGIHDRAGQCACVCVCMCTCCSDEEYEPLGVASERRETSTVHNNPVTHTHTHMTHTHTHTHTLICDPCTAMHRHQDHLQTLHVGMLTRACFACICVCVCVCVCVYVSLPRRGLCTRSILHSHRMHAHIT